MLSADSSTLNSDSDVQISTTAPTIPNAAALSWSVCTILISVVTELSGNAWLSSVTR